MKYLRSRLFQFISSFHKHGDNAIYPSSYDSSLFGNKMLYCAFYKAIRFYNSQIAELSKEDIDHMLRRNEKSTLVGRDAIHSYDSNQLPANSPCEDNYAEARCEETNAMLFGVFDGHAGETCSKAVSRRLFDYLALCLLPREKLKQLVENLNKQRNFVNWWSCSAGLDSSNEAFNCHRANLRNFIEYCVKNHEEFKNVRQAFQNSFEFLDQHLAKEALNILKEKDNLTDENLEERLATVLSGSCACVVHVRGQHLHVANVGDSVAVLGVCNEKGEWVARQLTKEHCIDNEDEVQRIRQNHPVTESTTVLRAGRLLGQLFPLRAFGDVRYKWDVRTQEKIFGKRSLTPPNLMTPPYLTAKPEVFYQRLTPHDKFLVVASDGLWEQLSPESVVRIISDHMTGRQTLAPYVPPVNASCGEVLTELRLRKLGESKRPLDANGATHLIRCALGGTAAVGVRQYRSLANFLSRPEGKKARSMRDDITIIVIYFDPGYLATSPPS